MSMAKILVVDDEPFNLDIVAEYLDEMDFELVMVESGEAAWDELTRPDSSFDLVLLDRMMPGMDGIQVLKKIKGDAELRGIPVIMQTAATSPEQVREGLAAGAFYYLTKPFEGEALQTIIRSALDDMRTRRELNANLADHAVALACCLAPTAVPSVPARSSSRERCSTASVHALPWLGTQACKSARVLALPSPATNSTLPASGAACS